MLKPVILFIFIATAFGNTFAQDSKRENVSITIYNNNFGVVQEERSIQLEKGMNEVTITDVPQTISPSSVSIKLDAAVIEQNYRYDLVNMGKILHKYIDKDIILTGTEKTLSGRLLSVSSNQIVLQKPDGSLEMLPDYNDYTLSVPALPDGLITKPSLVWLVQSDKKTKTPAQLTYQSGGFDWDCQYTLVMEDDENARLNSWVSITNNSGTIFKNADLKLLAGDVRRFLNIRGARTNETQIRIDGLDVGSQFKEGYDADRQFSEKPFFEYHIYELQRKATLNNNETKQIALFNSEKVNIDKEYKYNVVGNDKGKARIYIKFRNSEANGLAKPMPQGIFSVYQSANGQTELVGEDYIKHTPKDEEIELYIGNAFDVVCESKISDNRKLSKKRIETEYEVEVRNMKNKEIELELLLFLGNCNDWEIIESPINFEQKDASTISGKIKVPGYNIPQNNTKKIKITIMKLWY